MSSQLNKLSELAKELELLIDFVTFEQERQKNVEFARMYEDEQKLDELYAKLVVLKDELYEFWNWVNYVEDL